WPHLDFEVAEVCMTGQVLQWYPTGALVDQCLEVRGLGIFDGVQQRKSGQLDSGSVCQQLPSILFRRADADLAQLSGSLMQQRSNSLGHCFAPPSWESRSWVSASCNALITASRSPSRT